MNAQQIKKLLKEKYLINPKYLKIKTTYSKIDIRILHHSVDADLVENELKHLEKINRCEVSGDILSGGNFFVFIQIAAEIPEEIKKEGIEYLANVAERNFGTAHHLAGHLKEKYYPKYTERFLKYSAHELAGRF